MFKPCKPFELDLSGTPAQYFEAGDYTTAAMVGTEDDWRTYAAAGLIAKSGAVEGLSRFEHLEEARFYRGVAHWILGDEDAALRDLLEVKSEHAQNLVRLIRKQRIEVLCQLPWQERGTSYILGGALHDQRFKLSQIGFKPGDHQNLLYGDIHRYYREDNPPDFYLCKMVEWHYIPPNINTLPCPVIGHTADFDLHIQTVHPWFSLFDELLVHDGTELQVLREIVYCPISTMPKSFGIPENPPEIMNVERNIDLFQSGTSSHPYHPDKMALIDQVIDLKGIQLYIQNGFLGHADYHRNLNHAKICYAYTRHSGCLPTRAIESLSMGCASMIQKESVLGLYYGEESGVYKYDYEARDFNRIVHHILKNWDEVSVAALSGAHKIREEFSLRKVASQYLRYVTFVAARPRPPRPKIRTSELMQKRAVIWKGWTPPVPRVWNELSSLNFMRLQDQINRRPTETNVNELLREKLMSYYSVELGLPAPRKDDKLLRDVFLLCHQALPLFPESLVLRFNLIRGSIYFGHPEDVSNALSLIDDVLNAPLHAWRVRATDDVMSWDFANILFDYRRYLDLATLQLANNPKAEDEMIQLIRASLYYHLAPYTANIRHFRMAHNLNDTFAYFGLGYARALLRMATPEADREAGTLLQALARSSLVMVEATDLLLMLKHEKRFVCAELADLEIRATLMRNTLHKLEQAPEMRFMPAMFHSTVEGTQ